MQRKTEKEQKREEERNRARYKQKNIVKELKKIQEELK